MLTCGACGSEVKPGDYELTNASPEPSRAELRERVQVIIMAHTESGYPLLTAVDDIVHLLTAAPLPAPQDGLRDKGITHGRLQHDRIASIQSKAREIDLLCHALTGLPLKTFDEDTLPAPSAVIPCPGCGATDPWKHITGCTGVVRDGPSAEKEQAE